MSPPARQPVRFPNEIILEIFRHLDSRSYLEKHSEDYVSSFLDGDGSFRLPDATQTLKNASLVSRTWRDIARPYLFRYLYLRLLDWDPSVAASCRSLDGAISFIQDNHEWLEPVVQSITFYIRPSSELIEASCKAREQAAKDDLSPHDYFALITPAMIEDHRKRHTQWNPYGPLLDAVSRLSPRRMAFHGVSKVVAGFLRKRRVCFPAVENSWQRLSTLALYGSTKGPPGCWSDSSVPIKRFLGMGIGSTIIITEGPGEGVTYDEARKMTRVEREKTWEPGLGLSLDGRLGHDSFYSYWDMDDYQGPSLSILYS